MKRNSFIWKGCLIWSGPMTNDDSSLSSKDDQGEISVSHTTKKGVVGLMQRTRLTENRSNVWIQYMHPGFTFGHGNYTHEETELFGTYQWFL